jgi:hypothetical protein
MWAVSFEPQFSGLAWEAMKKQMQLAMFFSVTNGEIYYFLMFFYHWRYWSIYRWCNVGQCIICSGCKSSTEFYKGTENVSQCFPFLDQRVPFPCRNSRCLVGNSIPWSMIDHHYPCFFVAAIDGYGSKLWTQQMDGSTLNLTDFVRP